MTKLNYANRKSEGVKLGQTVAKDLKRRTKSPGSAIAVHTPIELNLEGKNLTDDGIAEFASTLAEVLTPIDGHAAPAKLQTFNLQHNGLTTRALALLAPCIEAASQTLEDLDLSHNQIAVDDEQHRVDWRCFLRSFAGCPTLRRLSLSHNPLTSFQAFEVFADVYIRQFEANARCWEHDIEEQDREVAGLGALSLRDTNVGLAGPGKGKSLSFQESSPPVLGLPAIPVIGLDNVSMTDAGALFVSWVVERHKYAQVDHNGRLWMKMKDEADRAAIDVADNKRLTVSGLRLLSEAESVPYHPFKHEEEEDDDTDMALRRRQSSSAISTSRRTSGTATKAHKQSIDTGGLTSMPPLYRTTSFSELRNVRKRIQRNIIEVHGVQSVRLWHAAFRLLPLARELLLEDKAREDSVTLEDRRGDSPLPHKRRQSSNVSIQDDQVSPATTPAPASSPEAPASPQVMPTYASKLRFEKTRGSPVISIIEETRQLSTPAVLKPKEHARRASSSARSSPTPLLPNRGRIASIDSWTGASETSGRIAGDAVTLAQMPALKNAISMTDSKPRMVGPLPERVWMRVLINLVEADDIFTAKHLDSMLEYVRNRSTLLEEGKRLGSSDSVQRWKVLEQMGCLMY